jgi:hypothetical protein
LPPVTVYYFYEQEAESCFDETPAEGKKTQRRKKSR